MSNERKEYRLAKVEFRANTDNGQIEGYAAVFNTITDIGWFREQISPGAFKRAIAEKQDVRCLFNHDPNYILGRTTNGTLELSEDTTGLKFRCDMPDTTVGRDVRSSILRGDINQCSFGFVVRDEEVKYDADGNELRTIKDADLFDVSPVTYPAYPTTSVQARAMEDYLKDEKSKRDAEDDDGCECDCVSCTADNCPDCTDPDCVDEDCNSARSAKHTVERYKRKTYLASL